MNKLRVTLTANNGIGVVISRAVTAFSYGDNNNIIIMPYWNSKYYNAGGPGDTWDQYFYRIDHTFNDVLDSNNTRNDIDIFEAYPQHRIMRRTGPTIPEPERYNGPATILLPPKDRYKPNKIINKYLPFRDEIIAAADSNSDLVSGHTIGVHIRGPGRIHGGVPYLNKLLNVGNPPYHLYMSKIDKYLHKHPDANILLGTDAQVVVNRMSDRYGKRIQTTPAIRLHDGEPHANAAGDPYEMGKEALVDSILLSRCNHFVHGNSNLANYILCLNPTMISDDIYGIIINEF